MSFLSSILPPARAARYREVLRIATPLIISNSALTVMQFCDRLFLARYSSVSIQAALPAGILSFTFICLFAATAGYAGTFVAQYHGAGDRRQCIRVTAQGLWLALASLPFLLLLIPVGNGLMGIIGHAPEVLAEERIYFGWMMRGGFLVPLGWVIGGFFTGQSRMRLNTAANVIGALVNIVLDYAMIFGRLGFPEMGIAGGAIATVIASAVAPAIQFVYFLRTPGMRELGARLVWRPDFTRMGRIIRFGGPAGLHLMADVTAFATFVMLTGRLDAVSLAASNIALSINWLVVCPLMGISTAAAILTGQHQGRRDSDAACRAGWDTLTLAWGYMALMVFVFLLGSDAFFRLFYAPNADFSLEQLQRFGFSMMVAMSVWGLFDTATIVLTGALRGAGDTRFVMLYMLIMGWGFWIPGELLILSRGGGILHAWYWMATYVAILSFGFLWRWRSGRWRKIKLLEG
ncbi:MAG: MATE family efflux transporter [Lentisphaerae bacterium]|nr:MATE family efflux transporter [Lentisphaerota bacterium]